MRRLFGQKRNTIALVFLVGIIFVACDPSDSCTTDSKLTQYNGIICQIDFQSCLNTSNSTLTIQQCTAYSCRLSVQGRCYYYSYQNYPNSRCMRDCCGYNMTSGGQNYSDSLAQCLRLNEYQDQNNTDATQPPSNKMAIILGAVLGGVFVLVVAACICCRHKIKDFIVPNAVNRSNPNIQQNHVSLPQVNTIADINFIHESSSTQVHYEKQEECTICLEQSNDCRTHCSHWYHLQCLVAWVKKGFRCPNCTSQQLNPITVFCKQCKKPYAQIKISKYTQTRQLENQLNSYKCSQCKNQN